MVQLVNPLFDAAQVAGARSPGRSRETDQTLLGEVISGGDGSDALLGGASGGPAVTGGSGADALGGLGSPTATPGVGGGVVDSGNPAGGSTAGGRSGSGFISGLANNPLFQAGLAGITGSNPLTAFQIGLAAQARGREEARAAATQQQGEAELARLSQELANIAEESGDPTLKRLVGLGPTGFKAAIERVHDLGQLQAAPETFEEIKDEDGNVIAQRNTRTGKVIQDPRAPKLLSEDEFKQKVRLAQASQPEGQSGGPLVQLFDAQGQSKGSMRRDDPRVDQFLAANPGATVVSTSLQASSTEGLSRSDRSKGLKELRDARIATRQAIGTAEDIDQTLEEEGDRVLSAAGGIARATASIAAQVSAVVGIADAELAERLDPSRYSETFQEIGGLAAQSAELQSAIVNLAFAAAASSGQSGRDVSDRDVARFIREIGAGTASADTFRATLRSFARRLDRNLRIRTEETAGADEFRSVLTDRLRGDARPAPAPATPEARSGSPKSFIYEDGVLRVLRPNE